MRCHSFLRRAALGLLVLGFGASVYADPPKSDPAKTNVPKDKVHENVQADKSKPTSLLPVGYLPKEEWLKAPATPLQPGEIDRLVNAALKKSNVTPTPLTSDEQFIRRVSLDLTGRLPDPKDIAEFTANKSPNKRADLVNKLLDSGDYARHWSAYWREVISSRVQAGGFAGGLSRGFENWLNQQIKENKNWADVTKTILTAGGQAKFAEPDKNGEVYFLLSRRGADAQTEIAAETSRIFLGIQIQCAQCHDHPSDIWKRKNFHEFAAYFARMRDRFIFEEKKIVGTQLVSTGFGEHKMPNLDDPKKSTTTYPRFLDGKAPKAGTTTDKDRRTALADAIVSKENPWFAGAFVNRIWGELMGQSFYTPIDDMGPEKEAIMPDVLSRVSASFRANDYDVKQLFRDICASDAYQRQLRPGDVDDHELFAARHAARMSGAALLKALNNTLGGFGGPGGFAPKGGFGGFGRGLGLEGMIRQEFAFDPSTPAKDVEGSVAQILVLMNNPQIAQKIKAGGTGNMLNKILSTYTEDDEALRQVYLRTLSRRPTDREATRCKDFIRTVNNRNEAYEDILWALLNSAEFQTRR